MKTQIKRKKAEQRKYPEIIEGGRSAPSELLVQQPLHVLT
jgi:hypothetical protein